MAEKTETMGTRINQILGPSGLHEVPAYLDSGIFMLNLAMGQGYPAGHITEVSGDEGTAKTLLGLHACYNMMLQGGDAVYLDAEARLDLSLASGYVGINKDDAGWHYYPSDPKDVPWSIESACNAIKDLVNAWTGTPLCIVVDSVAALPSSLQDDDMTSKSQNMLIAKQWSRFFRDTNIIGKIRGKEIYIILLNQTRTEVNMFKYGPPKNISTGGRAIKYFSSIRIEMSKLSPSSEKTMKKDDLFAPDRGKVFRAFVEKNTVSPPHRKATFPFFFYPHGDKIFRGIDDAMSILMYLKKVGVINYKKQRYEGLGQRLNYFEFRDWIMQSENNVLAKQAVTEAYLQSYT